MKLFNWRDKGPRYSKKEREERGLVPWRRLADLLKASDIVRVMGSPVFVDARESAINANDIIADLMRSSRQHPMGGTK